MTTERVEHRAQQPSIDVEIFELALQHSATGVLAALGERDQAEEHLPGDLVGIVAEAAQQALGALHQRARDPAQLLVCRVGDAIPAPTVEQFGQACTATAARRPVDPSRRAAVPRRNAGSNVTPER